MSYKKPNHALHWLFVSALIAPIAGCSSRPGRVASPDVDASAAAAAAMEQFDANSNGDLNSDELAACPALAHALPRYDSDGDKSLDVAEIEAGIARWAESELGATPLTFRVQLDGRPLDGAKVKLVPEGFLKGSIQPAAGEAGRGGHGMLGMSPEDRPDNAPNMPLVQPGLYSVEITHSSKRIPAKYNTSTMLGLEVARDSVAPEGVLWTLTTGK